MKNIKGILAKLGKSYIKSKGAARVASKTESSAAQNVSRGARTLTQLPKKNMAMIGNHLRSRFAKKNNNS